MQVSGRPKAGEVIEADGVDDADEPSHARCQTEETGDNKQEERRGNTTLEPNRNKQRQRL